MEVVLSLADAEHTKGWESSTVALISMLRQALNRVDPAALREEMDNIKGRLTSPAPQVKSYLDMVILLSSGTAAN